VRIRASIAAVVLLGGLAAPAFAQFKEDDPGGVKMGESKVQRWRAGLSVDAAGGPCKGMVGYVPFPTEWPEQTVKTVEEDISPEIKVSYEVLEGTVKLMIVKIPYLDAGKEAKAVVTFEIRRHAILPPENTDKYLLPDVKKLDRTIAQYLAPSPQIESRDPKIRALARQIGADKEKAWEHVEAIYDWVRDKVEFREQAPRRESKSKGRPSKPAGKYAKRPAEQDKSPMKGALAALNDGAGDCEELTSLFIAICRAANIPARTVWVPGHCYPEFYLVDDKGEGHWFPCQAAGSRAFGGIPETRPILQKGDDFRPPWDRKKHLRYMAEHIEGNFGAGGGQPRVKFMREMVQ